MMDARDPMDRLSSAYTMEVGSETKKRHLAEMGAAIRTAPSAPILVGFGVRRRVAAVVAAVFLVAPAGMALAAEHAVPGDFLYPVKEITERVRSFVDDDIEATHRVEEVERLLFRRAPSHTVARAVERADSATVQLSESGELRLRLEIARERLQQQDEESRLAGGDGSGEGQQESGSDSEKAGPGAGFGTTVPSGSGGSSEQDQKEPGTTGTTLGSGRSEQGSGDAAGTTVDPSGTPSTKAPQNSEGSSQP
ncbi:MAG: hypothetical protein M3096_09315 [Actinomycetia bacterium]|nr:hypothetical protein [Actinomycetes bacterium]